MECLGCKLANSKIETNVIFENEIVTCILDIAPIHEGHILILPKKHFHDVYDLDEGTGNEIMRISKLISQILEKVFEPSGITILQNGGKFNDLTHYHMHVFPRYEGDGFSWVEPSDHTNARDRLPETKQKLLSFFIEVGGHL